MVVSLVLGAQPSRRLVKAPLRGWADGERPRLLVDVAPAQLSEEKMVERLEAAAVGGTNWPYNDNGEYTDFYSTMMIKKECQEQNSSSAANLLNTSSTAQQPSY